MCKCEAIMQMDTLVEEEMVMKEYFGVEWYQCWECIYCCVCCLPKLDKLQSFYAVFNKYKQIYLTAMIHSVDVITDYLGTAL